MSNKELKRKSDFIKMIKMITVDYKHQTYDRIKQNIIDHFKTENISFSQFPSLNIDECISELPFFTKGDFGKHIEEKLWRKIYKDLENFIKVPEPELWKLLNSILDIANFYDEIIRKKKMINNLNHETALLISKTEHFRNEGFISLSYSQKFDIRKLNRILIEDLYGEDLY